jgi:hypothetical protein
MGYACYRTHFHTIIVYFVASRDLYTHIHYGVNSSFGKIEKFNRRLGTISLREFRATFSIVIFELELKYGFNYTKSFTFKQLTRYVHYEALDVYEQHSPRILGVTHIPNPTYATTITTTSQPALQATITHHGTMLNNPNPVPTSLNLSPQQLITITRNNLPTIDAPTFVDPMGELFQVLELEFPVKNSEKKFVARHLFSAKA